LQQEVLEGRVRILGEEHPDTLTTKHNLASTYQAQGKIAEAAKLEEEVLEKRVKMFGDEHPDTLLTKHNLAYTYQSQGKTSEAVRFREEVRAAVGRGKGSFDLRRHYEQL
jgi:Tetratricopeptide repeat